VLSASQIARIGTGPLVAFWADGVRDRRTPLRVLGIGATAAFAVFFFVAQGFWQLLICGFLALTLSQAASPLVEGALLRATAQERRSYGFSRGIGSLSFIAANVAGGVVIARFGLDAVAVWVISGYGIYALSALIGLKPDPAPIEAPRGARAR